MFIEWGECMEANGEGWRGYLTWITCKPQVTEMNTCLKHYYTDPTFKEECKQIYLEKRKRYRETGIIEKETNRKQPYYQSERKKNFLEEYNALKAKMQAEEASNSSNSSK